LLVAQKPAPPRHDHPSNPFRAVPDAECPYAFIALVEEMEAVVMILYWVLGVSVWSLWMTVEVFVPTYHALKQKARSKAEVTDAGPKD
jgi:hypothetical protein